MFRSFSERGLSGTHSINWGNNWGNRPITFRLQHPSHRAQGDAALIPAVRLVRNGTADQPLFQKRIQVLPGRFLLRIAKKAPDLGDASRLIHTEKEDLVDLSDLEAVADGLRTLPAQRTEFLPGNNRTQDQPPYPLIKSLPQEEDDVNS